MRFYAKFIWIVNSDVRITFYFLTNISYARFKRLDARTSEPPTEPCAFG